jgi:GTP:adenosylcobinamide-phosphate guanylyltransferase
MNAVILAGGKAEVELGQWGSKALIQLKGTPMIVYVINALRTSQAIDKLLVVGDVELLQPIIGDEVDYLVEDQEDIMENLLYALKHFPDEEKVLVATCDVPLLKGEMVADFISMGLGVKADILYPIAERSQCSLRYPDVKRTYATLREGDFTGGNLFILAPIALDNIIYIGRKLIANRKNPLKMCSYLGLNIIYRYIIRRLSVFELEVFVKERFGIEVRALVCSIPELCQDLDRVEDIGVFEKYL